MEWVQAWCALVVLAGARGAALASPAATDVLSACAWRSDLADGGEELACSPRTAGDARALLAAPAAAQARRVTALTLRCTDKLFFESSLEMGRRGRPDEGLARFPALRRLRVDWCKLRCVPPAALAAAPGLRELALRSHNTDWAAMSLELHRDTFRGLAALHALDLSDNNIWTLPAEVFCPLHALRSLNLTRNRLRDVAALGFSDWGEGPTAPGKSCNSALESLDLSHNELGALPDNGLSSLRALRRLQLQHGRVASVADRAFVGLAALQLLDLSSNALQALPPETFQSSRDLRQVHLHNNSLSVLAPGLLEGLDQLQILDLSANRLTSDWVNRDTFCGLVRLIVLNLAENLISKVDVQLFQDLHNLQFLSLERNRISRVSEGAFANLNNLHSLSLAHNEILQVEISHFSNLYVLNQLFLDCNKISKINSRSFENITKLHDLGLSGNQLTEVPEAVKSLQFLTSLDLGSNRITRVSNSQLEGLDELYGLQLVANKIEKISKDTFAPLSALQILNLASNNIDRIDEGAFASSGALRALSLGGNRLTDLGDALAGAQQLAWLNVSDNRLLRFDYAQVPRALQWLDLSHNRLERLEDAVDARAHSALKLLDVGHNLLRALDADTLPDALETAVLQSNRLVAVAPGALTDKRALARLVLVGNELRGLREAALAGGAPGGEAFLADNPLLCDCELAWLPRATRADTVPRLRVADLEALSCELRHARAAAHIPLLHVQPSEFLCVYESHCSATCHCCDFDACDCEMMCPERCTCYRDTAWTANVVDCSGAGYRRVPDRIPMDATQIYLDGNRLLHLGNHVFLGKKRLQTLYLNNSNLVSLENKTFTGIESLKELYLHNNKLSEIRSEALAHLPRLSTLRLDGNRISRIDNDTFQSMRDLSLLALDRNGPVQFLPWRSLGAGAARARITVDGVSWPCACENVEWLVRWFTEHDLDPQHTQCRADNTTVTSAAALCRAAAQRARGAESRVVGPSGGAEVGGAGPALVAALAAAALLLLSCALLALCREDVALWVRARLGVRSSRPDCKLYDALVAYSPLDADLVTRALASELELRGRALCLQHRDLPPAERRARAALAAAAERARRLVLVLSAAFLQREWGAPATRDALQSAVNSVRTRARIVFLVTTDLGALRVDPEMKGLLETCTVILWGERLCWKRLALALPGARRAGKAAPPERAAPAQLRYTAPPARDSACDAHDSRSTESSDCACHAYAAVAAPPPQPPHSVRVY